MRIRKQFNGSLTRELRSNIPRCSLDFRFLYKMLNVYSIFRICKEILEKDKFAVHDEDFESNTALHLACLHGHSRVVNALITNGADIQCRNYLLWTPLDCAAAHGQPKCARMLLDSNADINPMDKNKTTPLHLTARYGHEKTAKLLIERGASVTQINSSGFNPLVTAIWHGKRYIFQITKFVFVLRR